MTLRKTAFTAVLALAGLTATADRASAQFFYSYNSTPFGGYYNSYSVAPAYSYGYSPYGLGVYNVPSYSYYRGGFGSPYYGGWNRGYYGGYRSFYAPRYGGYGYGGYRRW